MIVPLVCKSVITINQIQKVPVKKEKRDVTASYGYASLDDVIAAISIENGKYSVYEFMRLGSKRP